MHKVRSSPRHHIRLVQRCTRQHLQNLRRDCKRSCCAADTKNAEREHLKGELQGYVKERQALKVIVDKKIKLFVAEIMKSLDSMEVDETAKVRRQSKALMQLVDSTAAALHTS